ncbi:MAG: hypothetical protein HY931_00810 [Candidatus Falkowbacteria bacterium]|nr:MAG: hypothetical protein HY931_00810 [Candidatus Falkowbacteria bacterium]
MSIEKHNFVNQESIKTKDRENPSEKSLEFKAPETEQISPEQVKQIKLEEASQIAKIQDEISSFNKVPETPRSAIMPRRPQGLLNSLAKNKFMSKVMLGLGFASTMGQKLEASEPKIDDKQKITADAVQQPGERIPTMGEIDRDKYYNWQWKVENNEPVSPEDMPDFEPGYEIPMRDFSGYGYTHKDLMWNKLPTLDFSERGFENMSAREKAALFVESYLPYKQGRIPEINPELLNLDKKSATEVAKESLAKGILTSQEGFMPKVKGHEVLYDAAGKVLRKYAKNDEKVINGELPHQESIDAKAYKNTLYDLNLLDKRTELVIDPKIAIHWKTFGRLPKYADMNNLGVLKNQAINGREAKQGLSLDEIRCLPQWLKDKAGITGELKQDIPLMWDGMPLDQRTGSGTGLFSSVCAGLGLDYEHSSREEIDKKEAEVIKFIQDEIAKGAKYITCTYPINQRGGYNQNKDLDLEYKKYPENPDYRPQIKSLVEKIKSGKYPTIFKLDETPLEKMMDRVPSLFSGLYEGSEVIPFSEKGKTLQDFASKDKLTAEDMKFINTEMLKADVLESDYKVRDELVAYMKDPRFVTKLIARHQGEEYLDSITPKFGNDPKWDEYKKVLENYAFLRDRQIEQLSRSPIGKVVGNYRLGVPLDAAMSIPIEPLHFVTDVGRLTETNLANLSARTSGLVPEVAAGHEMQHVLQHAYPTDNALGANMEAYENTLTKFLEGYKKEDFNAYYSSEGGGSVKEFDADLIQFKYNLANDLTSVKNREFVKAMIATPTPAEIDTYLKKVSTEWQEKRVAMDPAVERIMQIWENSTPAQKKQLLKIMDVYV